MRRTVRVLACASVAPALVLMASPAAAAQSPAQDQSSSSSFIQALSSIPAASEAVAKAREAMRTERTRAMAVQALADEAQARYAGATSLVHDVSLARHRADRSLTESQDLIDTSARMLYVSGGTVPSLAEVLLTSDSPAGFAGSMLTRQYLSSAAGTAIGVRARAERAVQDAAMLAASAQQERRAAADAAITAQASAQAAADLLADAHASVDEARATYRRLMRITSTDRSAEYGRIKVCGDWVTRLLSRSGFEGEDLREAWAIVMRESGGREDAISESNDLGLFQINTATWREQPWFDRKELLTRKYNAKIGHLLSRAGKSWYSWGLDGHGRPDPRAYVKAGWTPEHITASIIEPYIAWYAQYPCRPAYEKDNPYPLPPPRALEPAVPASFAGGGTLPGSPTMEP